MSEFHSQAELLERVKPALIAREKAFRRFNCFDVQAMDIWDYLSDVKWKYGKELMLSDIVNDIMNVSIEEIKEYKSERLDDFFE